MQKILTSHSWTCHICFARSHIHFHDLLLMNQHFLVKALASGMELHVLRKHHLFWSGICIFRKLKSLRAEAQSRRGPLSLDFRVRLAKRLTKIPNFIVSKSSQDKIMVLANAHKGLSAIILCNQTKIYRNNQKWIWRAFLRYGDSKYVTRYVIHHPSARQPSCRGTLECQMWFWNMWIC